MSVAISVPALFVWPKKFLFSNTSERSPLGGSLFCISSLPRLPGNVNAYPLVDGIPAASSTHKCPLCGHCAPALAVNPANHATPTACVLGDLRSKHEKRSYRAK